MVVEIAVVSTAAVVVAVVAVAAAATGLSAVEALTAKSVAVAVAVISAGEVWLVTGDSGLGIALDPVFAVTVVSLAAAEYLPA